MYDHENFRMEHRFAPNLTLKLERDFRVVQASNKCPGFKFWWDGFCSLETKHDRSTVPGRSCLLQRGECRNIKNKSENGPGLKSR